MDTQAFTQADQGTRRPRSAATPNRAAPDDEWTVDDVVRSIRNGRPSPASRTPLGRALGALVLAAAATATAGMSADQAVCDAEAGGAAVANRRGCRGTRHVPGRRVAGARGAARRGSRPRAGHPPVSRSRSLDRRHAGRPGLPVARRASRSPGSRSAGRTVRASAPSTSRCTSADASSRAPTSRCTPGASPGCSGSTEPIDQADAELRFSDPANPAQAAVIRSITLDAPSTTRVSHGRWTDADSDREPGRPPRLLSARR